MILQIAKFSEEQAQAVYSWQYEGVYGVYNAPAWEEIREQKWAMTDPDKREEHFRSVVSDEGILVGFFRMMEADKMQVQIGLGMTPTYCGRGLGKLFVKVITNYVQEKYPGYKVGLEVMTFNQRAIKCYESVGYKMSQEQIGKIQRGENEYYRMVYVGEASHKEGLLS